MTNYYRKYSIISKTKFVYYFREAEFGFNISKKTDEQKEKLFIEISKTIHELNEYELYSEKEIP